MSRTKNNKNKPIKYKIFLKWIILIVQVDKDRVYVDWSWMDKYNFEFDEKD